MSLFPTAAARGAAQSASLHKFNAGKCNLVPTSNGKFMVTADPRRGQIILVKDQSQILHFKWVNLANGTVEGDRSVFGGDFVFKRVKTGREDVKDRVYMLKFKAGASGAQPLLFWMQDVDASKDEEKVKKTNDLLDNPNSAAAPGLGGLIPPTAGANPPWANLLGQSPAAAPASAAPGSFGNLDLSALLANLGAPPMPSSAAAPAAASAAAAAAPARARVLPTPGLEEVLNAEGVVRTGILEDPAVQAELIPLLPPGQQSAEQLETAIRSPQMQQSLRSLSNALSNPDNFQSVMSNFGIDPAPGTAHLVRGDGVGAFLTSLQASADSATAAARPPQPPQDEGDEKKDDTEMDQS